MNGCMGWGAAWMDQLLCCSQLELFCRATSSLAAAPSPCPLISSRPPPHLRAPLSCSVLMGANIAGDIARGELSEATVGFNVLENALLLQASQQA